MGVRPRIALCVETPTAVRGGVSVLVDKLIKGLSEDFQIILVSADREVPPDLEKYLAGHLKIRDDGKPSREDLRVLARQLIEAKVALAHFHFGEGYGWGTRLPGGSPFPTLQKQGIRVVTTIHMTCSVIEGYCDLKKPLWFKLLFFPIAWMRKASALRFIDHEWTVSKEMMRRLRRWFFPWKSRIESLYHSRLDEKDLLPLASAVPREKRILCVGHLAERKGQRIAAEAFVRIAARFPAWEICFLGDSINPNMEHQIRALAKASGLSDRMLLPGPSQQALEEMQRAAIFLQPSFHEGLPLSLQEAMASGCACVATRISGNVELVADGQTGKLVPPGDVEAMSEALATLITDTALRDRLGEAARTSISEAKMSAPGMVARHRALYQSLLQSTSP